MFEILFEVVSIFLGERLTKRIKMYSGEDDMIRQRLTRFGINELPEELGGQIRLDQDEWIAERRQKESSSSPCSGEVVFNPVPTWTAEYC